MMKITSSGPPAEGEFGALVFVSYYFHKTDTNGNDVYLSSDGWYIFFSKIFGQWIVSIISGINTYTIYLEDSYSDTEINLIFI